MGIRSWPAFLVATGLFCLCLLVGGYYLRRGMTELPLGVVVVSAAALLSTMTVFGPLVFLPGVAVVMTMFFVLGPTSRRRRPVALAITVLTAVPVLLQWLGLIPASYRVQGEALCIQPWMVHLSGRGATPALLWMTLLLILTGWLIARRYRQVITAAEERLHLHAWQLRQIVPETELSPGRTVADRAIQEPSRRRSEAV
jgi:hypothetical protein